jgi:hypothetical protein
MDIQTLYYRTITTIFAWVTVALFPLCVLTLIMEPPEKSEIFDAPPDQQDEKPKKVTVPLYPTFRELSVFLVSLLAEMVLLCPYLPIDETKPQFSQYWGFPLFAYHGFRAICLAAMETNWMAAQEHQGLWHLKGWKLYYLLQILMGIMVGLPLLFRLAAYGCMAVYQLVPIVYWSLRTAYGPLN